MRIINKRIVLFALFFLHLALAWKANADVLITGNDITQITTWDVGGPSRVVALGAFTPDEWTGQNGGYGLAIQNFVTTNGVTNTYCFYTYEGPASANGGVDENGNPVTTSRGVNVCRIATNGAGTHDIELIPNRDGIPHSGEGSGINALAFHNGMLYMLTGGYRCPLHIWVCLFSESVSNYLVVGPTDIGAPACLATNYYGPTQNPIAFVVLTNGNYLIQDYGGGPGFREYGKTGKLVGPGGLFIDMDTWGYGGAIGACMSSDQQSLYFNVGTGLIQTDLQGNYVNFFDFSPNGIQARGLAEWNERSPIFLTNALPPFPIAQLSPLGYTAYTNAAYTSTTLVSTQRVQQVYKASQFPPDPILITALRFRPAEAPYGSAFSTTISNIQINLSATTNSPNGLSTTFLNNVGSNDVVVYNGPLAISSAYTGNDNGPRDNDIIIPLKTPFLYDPTKGNLLLDIRNFSGDPGNHAYTSTFNTTNDTGSRVASSNPNATTGSADTAADEVTFVYYGANVCAAPNYTAYAGSTNASDTLITAQRSQQVYKSLQFPSDPILITELHFRPAKSPFGGSFTNTISNIQINLSTTANPPDGLSTNFADNAGSDDQIVYSGALAISSASTGDDSGAPPRDADIVVHLQTPFAYDPSQGNLLLDIRHFSDDTGNGAYVEMFNKTNDTGSRVVSSDPDATSASVSDSRVDAVNFIYQGDGSIFAPNYSAYSVASASSSTLIVTQRIQQVYTSTQFPPAPIKITELRFRSGQPPYGGAFSTTIGNIQINLSTTSHTPGALSSTFANNVGADDTNVYSGSLHISSANTGSDTGPKDADIVVHLQKPFIYDPSKGNLLMDIRHLSDDTGNGAYTMCFGESDDAGSRVVGLNPNATTASFSDTGVDAVNFIYTDASQ